MQRRGQVVPFKKVRPGDLVLVFWKDAFVGDAGDARQGFAPSAHVGFVHKVRKDSLCTSCIPAPGDTCVQYDVIPAGMVECVLVMETAKDLLAWVRSLFLAHSLPDWAEEAVTGDKPK